MSFDGQRVVIIGASAGSARRPPGPSRREGAAVIITGRSKERLDQAAQRIGYPGRSGRSRRDQTARRWTPSSPPPERSITWCSRPARAPWAQARSPPSTRPRSGRRSTANSSRTSRRSRRRSRGCAPDGSVTIITAASARAAFAGTAGLAAANGALEAMVAPLAVELAPLRVNAVSPGVIDTHWWNGMPDDQRRAYFDAMAAVTPVRRVGRAGRRRRGDRLPGRRRLRHRHRPGVHRRVQPHRRRARRLTGGPAPADQRPRGSMGHRPP